MITKQDIVGITGVDNEDVIGSMVFAGNTMIDNGMDSDDALELLHDLFKTLEVYFNR